MTEIKLKSEDGKLLTILAKDGKVGADGKDGAKGDTGDVGPIGPHGTDGVKGDQGTPGTKGDSGLDGLDGRHGIDGLTGKQGPKGIDGKSLSKKDIDKIGKTLDKEDNLLWVNNGAVKSVSAGTNVTVDNTDPQNPSISAVLTSVDTFIEDIDTPSTYVGSAGLVPIVNVGETALEFGAAGVTDHTLLTNIGTNAHSVIDTFLANNVIGTNTQAWDNDLDDIAALTPTLNNFMIGDGTDWALNTPAQAVTALGLDAGGAGDIWVEKAGDTMTGTLTTRNIALDTDNIYSIGTATVGLKIAYFGTNTAGAATSRAKFKGLHLYTDTCDTFVGNDNAFVNYYAQKSTVTNSLVTDNTEDYTNLFQGDAIEPYIYTNFFTGSGLAASAYAGPLNVGFEKGGIIQGNYDWTNALGGAGIYIEGKAKSMGTYICHDAANTRFNMRSTSATNMANVAVTSWGFGGGLVTDIVPIDSTGGLRDNAIDLGLASTGRWKDLFLGGTITHAGNIESVTAVKTANYTIVATDDNVPCDTSGGAFQVNLPATPSTGQLHGVILDVAGNTLTVSGNGKNINGSGTMAMVAQYLSRTFLYNGTQWNIK